MSILDPLIDAVDAVMYAFAKGVKQFAYSDIDAETVDDSITLVASDGSLFSIMRVDGVKELVGREEFEMIHRSLTLSLQSYLGAGGHAIQVHFMRDHDSVQREITRSQAPARQAAEALNLDLADLFDERENHLSKFCATEKNFFVLWTRPSALSKSELSKSSAEKSKTYKKNKVPPVRDGQNLLAAIPELRHRHRSFCRALLNDLKNLKFMAGILEIHSAVREIRASIDSDFTADNWRPYLPGDKIIPRQIHGIDEFEAANVCYPPLQRQIVPRDLEIVDGRTIQVGNRIYSPLYVEVPPREIMHFTRLLQATIDAELPWQFSFLIESGGIDALRMKTMATSILSWAGMDNKLINAAKKELDQVVMDGETVVKLKMAMATWAPANQPELLHARASQLARAVESWGYAEVRESTGDPQAGLISSAMGASSRSIANFAAAPLVDVVEQLPIARPASPWQSGAITFRSQDGKLWPYQPGSTLQTTWIDLIFARPGSGKSVLLNQSNLALCLEPGSKRLPRIAIIDIGPSSSGLISLLREALPEKDRHLVAYHRLRMTPAFSINPLDTQLGCRFPTPQERGFLVNLLTLLATPVGAERPYEGVADIAGMVIDEVYKELSDAGGGHPRAYAKNIDPAVDRAVADAGLRTDKRTTWWEIVDGLFDAGMSHEAGLAQRYAVPLLADAASMARHPAVMDLYKKSEAPTSEPLVDAFSRMISSAIREYPILAKTTQFDIGDARVVSFDLDEVAKPGGETADRQTAVMYMLSRHVLARHFYLTPENVGDFPEKYRNYHRDRIAEIREDKKRICFDEFHRTSKAKAVRDQVVVDMREGRKWGVMITLASQSIDDFVTISPAGDRDDTMIQFATSVFVMDAGPASTVEKLASIFGLSDTAKNALTYRVRGPQREGVTFLAQFFTKGGQSTQLITSTLGPIELWAFNTTSEDVIIRNRLYKALGPAEARRRLARVFSSGSAKDEVDRLRAQLRQDTGGGLDDEKAELGAIEQVVQMVLERRPEKAAA